MELSTSFQSGEQSSVLLSCAPVGVLALASVAPEVRPITCPASVDIMKVDNVDFVDFATCTKKVKNVASLLSLFIFF